MKQLNLILIFITLTLAACGGDSRPREEVTQTQAITQSAKPEIITAFDQLDERYFHMKDTLLIVNFWATWCKPCVRELPDFNEAAKQYQGQPVKFLFVSLDFLDTVEKSLIPFIKANPFNGEVVVLADQDVNTWAINIDNNWDGAIPVTMAVKNGKKSTKMGAFRNLEELDSFIKANI